MISQPEEVIYERANTMFGKYPSVIQMFPLINDTADNFEKKFAEKIAKGIIKAIGKDTEVQAYSDRLSMKPKPESPAVIAEVFCFAIFNPIIRTPARQKINDMCKAISKGKIGYRDAFSLWRAIFRQHEITVH